MTIHVEGFRRMRTTHLPQHDGPRNPAPPAATSASTLPKDDPMPYVAFDQRTPDAQYRDLLRRIIEEGEDVPSNHGVPARRIVGYLIRFHLANGFPIITERDLVSPPPGRAPRPRALFSFPNRVHIYNNQSPHVEKMPATDPQGSPAVTIDRSV